MLSPADLLFASLKNVVRIAVSRWLDEETRAGNTGLDLFYAVVRRFASVFDVPIERIMDPLLSAADSRS